MGSLPHFGLSVSVQPAIGVARDAVRAQHDLRKQLRTEQRLAKHVPTGPLPRGVGHVGGEIAALLSAQRSLIDGQIRQRHPDLEGGSRRVLGHVDRP